MADVAALTGDASYMAALDKIWEDVVGKKLYLTGGIGAAGGIEGFGPAYDLPNANGYAETCADDRLRPLELPDVPASTATRNTWTSSSASLYNGFLSGVALSGDLFFYPNPLASRGAARSGRPGSAAPAARRTSPASSPRWADSSTPSRTTRVYVNLFAQGTAEIETAGRQGRARPDDAIPLEGRHQDRRRARKGRGPDPDGPHSRLGPGTAAAGRPLPLREADRRTSRSLKVNGEAVAYQLEKGYAPIAPDLEEGRRRRAVPAHARPPRPGERERQGRRRPGRRRARPARLLRRVGRQRRAVSRTSSSIDGAPLAAEIRADLAQRGRRSSPAKRRPIRMKAGGTSPRRRPLTLIPYYAWAHRGQGEMAVWLARGQGQGPADPRADPRLDGQGHGVGGRPGASTGVHDLSSSRRLRTTNPAASSTGGRRRGRSSGSNTTFRNPRSSRKRRSTGSTTPATGECRVPASWRPSISPADDVDPGQGRGSRTALAKDAYNTVRFAPVKTAALKLEIQLPEKFSSGIQEWKVK